MEGAAVVIAFWVLSAITLGAALMVGVVRDLIHAVLFLILSFIGVAGIYLTLSADFVAVVQVLIYAGAISVLMLFAILLTPRSGRDNAAVSYKAPISVIAGLIAATLVFVGIQTDWATVEEDRFETTAGAIGEALLDAYVLPFEVAAVLLTVAMIGAIILVRDNRQDREEEDG